MTRIKIFESARSEAGRNAQNRLEAMADIARAREQGADIEDADALPLALIDGKQAIAGTLSHVCRAGALERIVDHVASASLTALVDAATLICRPMGQLPAAQTVSQVIHIAGATRCPPCSTNFRRRLRRSRSKNERNSPSS